MEHLILILCISFVFAVVVKDEHGVDCNMGHRYYWTSRRVYVKEAGQFGETLVDSRQISNGFKLMYCGKV